MVIQGTRNCCKHVLSSLVRKSIHVAGCCFASSFAWPRYLIPSSKKLFFQFNMSKKTMKADRVQYGGCENCVTTLQHHNFPLHAQSWPFTRVCARSYGSIFSKNRFFGTTHGDKPTSQNDISLRSPSLIMAPGLGTTPRTWFAFRNFKLSL